MSINPTQPYHLRKMTFSQALREGYQVRWNNNRQLIELKYTQSGWLSFSEMEAFLTRSPSPARQP